MNPINQFTLAYHFAQWFDQAKSNKFKIDFVHFLVRKHHPEIQHLSVMWLRLVTFGEKSDCHKLSEE